MCSVLRKASSGGFGHDLSNTEGATASSLGEGVDGVDASARGVHGIFDVRKGKPHEKPGRWGAASSPKTLASSSIDAAAMKPYCLQRSDVSGPTSRVPD